MDVVMEKEPASEQRFGLLERCNHSFCLTCIRRWRNCKEFDNEVVMACPMCRRPSSFVTPSSSWVDMGEEKDKLLAAYKVAMSQKPCRYFKEGRGYCPFAGSCLYRHEYPDGSSAAGSRPRLRSFQSSDSDTADSPYLWDILDVVDSPQFANFYLGLEAEASNTSDICEVTRGRNVDGVAVHRKKRWPSSYYNLVILVTLDARII
ncbi:hypothetical protein V5799_024334 [Amblyomma americanum]|uniref:RING-type E3 ubiquitin transferase n=1 Tax=Amblyomma americanum TaxID=6943 RepID=A0AAQ4ECW3_AMBAM